MIVVVIGTVTPIAARTPINRMYNAGPGAITGATTISIHAMTPTSSSDLVGIMRVHALGLVFTTLSGGHTMAVFMAPMITMTILVTGPIAVVFTTGARIGPGRTATTTITMVPIVPVSTTMTGTTMAMQTIATQMVAMLQEPFWVRLLAA